MGKQYRDTLSTVTNNLDIGDYSTGNFIRVEQGEIKQYKDNIFVSDFTCSATPEITYGTYIPTPTNETGLTVGTMYDAYWSKKGPDVTVFGVIILNITTPGNIASVDLNIPFGSQLPTSNANAGFINTEDVDSGQVWPQNQTTYRLRSRFENASGHTLVHFHWVYRISE